MSASTCATDCLSWLVIVPVLLLISLFRAVYLIHISFISSTSVATSTSISRRASRKRRRNEFLVSRSTISSLLRLLRSKRISCPVRSKDLKDSHVQIYADIRRTTLCIHRLHNAVKQADRQNCRHTNGGGLYVVGARLIGCMQYAICKHGPWTETTSRSTDKNNKDQDNDEYTDCPMIRRCHCNFDRDKLLASIGRPRLRQDNFCPSVSLFLSLAPCPMRNIKHHQQKVADDARPTSRNPGRLPHLSHFEGVGPFDLI